MYYRLSLKEKTLNIEVTSNKIEIPSLEKGEMLKIIKKKNRRKRAM